jgi:hypothetical protein
VVEVLGSVRSISRATAMVLAILAGLGIAWATDYSVFAGWGIHFRALWMGPVATGLVIGALALLWAEVVTALRAYAGRRATAAPERPMSRVA